MITDLLRTIEQVSRDKGIDAKILIEALEEAVRSAVKKKFGLEYIEVTGAKANRVGTTGAYRRLPHGSVKRIGTGERNHTSPIIYDPPVNLGLRERNRNS